MAIDAALGRLGIKEGVCTSSTRPANPFEGQLIYETDTNRTLVYDNAAWLVVADNQVLSIDSANGRVGVGTDAPTAELDVRGSSSPEIRIVSTDASDPALYFGDSVDEVRGGLQYDISADLFRFRGYDNVSRMVIDSSGQVGVNDISPSYTLDVNGDINATGDLRIGGTAIGIYQDYVPAFTDISFGSYIARYSRVNNLVHVWFTGTLDAAVTGAITIGLPVTADATLSDYTRYGSSNGRDVSLNQYREGRIEVRGDYLRCWSFDSSGTGGRWDGTYPFTWASGDLLSFDLIYEAA